MANVRFYRLETLPSFNATKHTGIFVHVTETMHNNIWKPTVGNEVNPATLWMTPEKVGESVERINLVKWLSTRHITFIESGLWFGGENGWELLSNETNSAAINAAIDAKIATLNAGPYAQATISGSTLTISGIKENSGIIAKDDDNKLEVAIDGVYDKTNNKIATESTVTTAIGTLNVETPIQAVTTAQATDNNANTVLTFKGVKEENGKIVQGNGTDTFTVGDAKLKIQIGSSTASDVFSANAQADSTIQLDGNVFKKNGDVISVITKNNDVSSTNPLVTQNDINNLAGAMHYKGAITSANSTTPDNWPTTVAAGDVYIATGNFVKDDNTIESGDLIVFNSATLTDYKVVQSNITLGTGDGQIAKNVGVLADGKLVVASENGIETINFDKTNLTDTTGKNERNLSYTNGGLDGLLYHDVTISDAFTVIGKDFTRSINISSTNRSIEIAKKTVEGVDTGVMVDLVWNTSIE